MLNVSERDRMVSIAYDRVRCEFDVTRTVDALVAEFATDAARLHTRADATMSPTILVSSE
jgi:hypothetical protein